MQAKSKQDYGRFVSGPANQNPDIEMIVYQTAHEVSDFLSIELISVYLLEKDNRFHRRYFHGLSEKPDDKSWPADEIEFINEAAESKSGKIIKAPFNGLIKEKAPQNYYENSYFAYIPLKSIRGDVFGVVAMKYKKHANFKGSLDGILELIGCHFGLAAENLNLHKKHSKSEERHSILFNNIPHSIFLLDGKDFKIVDSNMRAQSAYGYTKEEFMKMSFLELSDEKDEEILIGLKSISENQYCRIAKKRFIAKNKQPFYVNVNISPAKYYESDLIIVSTTDITKSVEKEAQLIQAGKMATLGLMAAGMAHEINQPLNVIQVCADYFNKMLNRKQSIPKNDLSSMTKEIVSSVKRISETIKHVRDFSRQSEAIKSRIDINNAIQDAFRILAYKIDSHKITTELNLEPSLPPVLADHNRLESAFINLVNNSIDAINERSGQKIDTEPEKRITVNSFAEKGLVVVTITDTGIGMTENVKEKIFEPFFTTKKPGKGTGLGASTSYGIIKDYDGSITLVSEAGNGTSLEIKFPSIIS